MKPIRRLNKKPTTEEENALLWEFFAVEVKIWQNDKGFLDWSESDELREKLFMIEKMKKEEKKCPKSKP